MTVIEVEENNSIATIDLSGGISPQWFNAKGDLLAGVANNTLARLAVGSDGLALVADSGEETGLNYAQLAAAAIADQAITYSKIQNVSTTDRLLGRDSAGAGVVEEIAPAAVRTMLNVEDGADVTDATNVDAAGAVMEADYNANTILAATSDDTPAALTVAEQTLIGRITAGNIDALTATEVRTLLNVEDGSTADQSDAEIETAYNNQVGIVSQGDAEAGTSTTPERWTAERVKQAINALAPGAASTKQMWVGNPKPTVTNGCASSAPIEMPTNKNVYDYLAFDKDTIEYAYANVPMPDDWDASTVTAKFYWLHPAATAYAVVWGLQGVAMANDDPMDVAQGTIQTVTDTGGTTSDLYISAATAAMTIAGSPAAGEYVQFRIQRTATDGSDTLDVDAYLLGVLITYGVS